MFRCIDNTIPPSCSTSCLQPRKTRQQEEARKQRSSMLRRVAPPAGSIQLSLTMNCSGPRGRPLCIPLRWRTVWGGPGVFTSWGRLRRWTPAVTVCLPTEAGYKASFWFLFFDQTCHVRPLIGAKYLLVSWTVRRSVFDSLVSMRRKWGQHLRNTQTTTKIDTPSVGEAG